MKASELRINSTYLSVKFNTPVILTAEDIWELVAVSEGASIDYYINLMFEPIELTEEWLENDPFSKTIENIYETAFFTYGDKIIRTFRIILHDNGFWVIIDWSNGDGTRSSLNLGTYKYIHELQNLYYFLADEELKLTIKES